MAALGGAYFPYISIHKTLKIVFSETNGPISIQLGRNVSLVTLYKDCSSRHDSSKNMAARGRGLFSLYIYIENFKNLLVRNSWTEFNVTWQECYGSSKAVVPVLVLLLLALWFILRGDLLYVFPCVILFLCFFSPFSIAITSLGEERANLSAFRTFVRFGLV